MNTTIEQEAMRTYGENVSYFKVHHPKTSETLSSLEIAIEKGYYQPRYDLQYKDGYFDIVELSSGNFLYGKNSNTHALLAAQSIDYSKEGNLFETFHTHHFTQQEVLKYEEYPICENAMSGFARILEYVDHYAPKETTLKAIQKFIFFGVGLGLHLQSIHERIHAKTYLIVEDDLELFRLSLFVTDYQKIGKTSTLFFAIFESAETFVPMAENFLSEKFYHNHYLKYFGLLSHSDVKRSEMHRIVGAQSHLLFFYNDLLKQYLKPLEYLDNQHSFINILTPYNDVMLEQSPIILVAAGPSLQKNIKWLKQNQNKFIIVALSATLSILEKEGIVPDIVTHLDGFDASTVHFKKLDSLAFLSETIFLLSARTPTEIVSILKKENLFFFENGTKYKKSFGSLSAPCVGSITYQLLLKLGVQNLYLLGLDLALDQNGQTHSEGHEYAQQITTNKSPIEGDLMTFRNTCLLIEGNFKKQVTSLPLFQISIEAVNIATQILKKSNQNVFNLNDGAKFLATTPLIISDIDTASLISHDKRKIRKNLHTIFKSHASKNLSHEEMALIKERLEYAHYIKSVFYLHQKNQKTTISDYLDSLMKLYNDTVDLKNDASYELSTILSEYFNYIVSYIFDLFNTRELKNPQNHIETVDQMVLKQLFRINDFYEEELRKFIEGTPQPESC